METYMFLCLHGRNLQESTKTCVSVYFLLLVLTFTPITSNERSIAERILLVLHGHCRNVARANQISESVFVTYVTGRNILHSYACTAVL